MGASGEPGTRHTGDHPRGLRGASATLLLVGLVASCGFAATMRVVKPSELENLAATRIRNSLSAPSRRDNKKEEFPQTATPAATQDEAVLARVEAGEVCVQVLMRTEVSVDKRLSEWRIDINGQQATITKETIAVRDFPCTGEAPKLIASNLTQKAYMRSGLRDPAQILFRVIERRAVVCAARSQASPKVRLSLVLPSKDRRGDWGEVFEWRLPAGR